MTYYAVQCREHTTKPIKTREAAERRLAQIEAVGMCREWHEIVEVPAPRR